MITTNASSLEVRSSLNVKFTFPGLPGGSVVRSLPAGEGTEVPSLAWKTPHQLSSSSVAQSCPIFATPWTSARQAFLSITNSQSLLKLMSIELVMLYNRLILCRPLLLLPSNFPSIRVFYNESVLHNRWPSTGSSASASVLLMNIQEWFPLELTGLISLQSTGLSRVFSSTTVWKH